jgi:gliding motility-associated-like protein
MVLPKFWILICLSSFLFFQAFAQIRVYQDRSPEQMVREIFLGNGVSVFNVRYTGADSAIGYYKRQAAGPNLLFPKGLILSTGNAKHAQGPNTNYNHTDSIPGASSINHTPEDPLLSAIVGDSTRDAAILEFDFIPTSDTIRFNYIFASEEYTEYVDWNFNDVFAFFISGPGIVGAQNIALLPGSTTPVTIKNVNPYTNSQFYVDNEYNGPNNPAPYDFEYDGFTFDTRNRKALTAVARIPHPCQVYRLRISIADVYDGEWDSAVLLEAGSLSSPVYTASATPGVMGNVDSSITYEACNGDIVLTFTRPATSGAEIIPITVAGTAQKNIDYTLSRDIIEFLPGERTAQIKVNVLLDNQNEPIETVRLIYQSRLMCKPDTVTFYISDPPSRINISPSPDTAFCFTPGGKRLSYQARIQPELRNFNYEWITLPGATTAGVGNTFSFIALSDTIFEVAAKDRVCNIPPLRRTIKARVYYHNKTLQLNLPDTIVCRGQAIRLTPRIRSEDLPLQYLWQDGSRQSEKTIIAASDTLLTLRAQDICSTATATARVRIARISTPSDTIVCQNSSIALWARLSPSGINASYHWIDQNNAILGNTSPLILRPTTNNQYSIRFAAPFDCLNRFFNVSLLPPLAVTFPRDTQVCAGQPFTMRVSATGGDNQSFTYRWYELNNLRDPIFSGPTFIHRLNQDGSFVVKVASPICQTEEQSPFYVRVIPSDFQLSPIEVLTSLPTCPNRFVPLRVFAFGGSGRYSYMWENNPAFNQSTHRSWVTRTTEVEVEATDNCIVKKQKKTLTAFSNIGVTGGALTICPGQFANLQPVVTGGCGVYTVAWIDERQDTIAISDILSLRPLTDRKIIVTVKDTCGSVASDTFKIRIANHLRIVNSLPQDTVVCLGETVRYRAQIQGAGNINYAWRDSASGQLLSNTAEVAINPQLGVTVLYLTYSDSCAARTQTFRIRAAPKNLRWEAITGPADSVLCINSQVRLQALVEGGSGVYRYQWSTGATAEVLQFSLTDTVAITLTVTDGCSRLDTVFRFYPLGVTYSIESTGGIFSNPQYPMVFKSCNGYIKFIFKRSEATLEQKFRIYFEPVAFPVSPAIRGVDFTVDRDTVHFRAGALTDTLSFNALLNNDPAPLKTVRLIFEPSNCQRLRQEFYILPPDTSIFTSVEPSVANLCVRPGGTRITATVTAFGGANIVRYEWRNKQGRLLSRRSRETFTILSDTVFYVTAFDTICALGALRDSVKVTVLNPGPRFLAIDLRDTVACLGAALTLSAKIDGDTPPVNVRWSNSTVGPQARYTVNSDTVIWATAADRCFTRTDSAKVYLAKIKTSSDTTVCYGAPLTLTANFTPNLGLALPFEWYSSTGELLSTGSSYEPSTLQSSFYIVKVPVLPCIEDTVKVNVLPPLILQVAPPPAICQGNALVVNARGMGGDGVYAWQWIDLASNSVLSTQSSLTYRPRQSGLVVVRLQNALCNATLQDTLFIKVYPRTLSIDSILPLTHFPLCPQDTLKIKAYVSGGTGNYSYRWSAGEPGNTSVISLVVAETTRVTLTVEDSCQTVESSIELWPHPPLSVSLPSDTLMCPGNSIRLEPIVTGGDGNYRFLWQAEDNSILGLEPTLTYTPAKESVVTLSLTDGCNRQERAQIHIRLFPDLNHNLASLKDTVLCFGQPVTYLAMGSGAGTVSYQWVDSVSGAILSDTPGLSEVFTESKTIHIILRDTCRIIKKAIKVKVIPNDLAWKNIILSPNQSTLCANSNITIRAAAQGGSGDYVYQWSNGTQGPIQTFTVDSSPYFISLEANDGCKTIDTLFQFSIFPPLTLEDLKDTVICAGASLEFTANPSGGSGKYWYLWQDSASGAILGREPLLQFNPLQKLTLQLTVQDSCGLAQTTYAKIDVVPAPIIKSLVDTAICAGNCIRLVTSIEPPEAIFRWSPSTFLDDALAVSPLACPANTQTYTLTAFLEDCFATPAVVTVRVLSLPRARISGSEPVICRGDSASLTAELFGGLPPYRILWQPSNGLSDTSKLRVRVSPSQTTEYGISAIDSKGCSSNVATKKVTVYPLPIADAGSDLAFCEGETGVFLKGKGIGGGVNQYRFEWSPPIGLNNPQLAQPFASPPSSPFTYTLTVISQPWGCRSQNRDDLSSVTVRKVAPPIVEAGGNAAICFGKSVLIGSPPVASYSYRWSPVLGLADPQAAQTGASPPYTTTYYLYVTALGCESFVDSVIVKVNPLPIVQAKTASSICRGDSVLLSATVSGPGPFTYLWQPASGLNNPSLATPKASPQRSMHYSLIVSSPEGCQNQVPASTYVEVLPLPTVIADTTRQGIVIEEGNSVTLPAKVKEINPIIWWAPSSGLDNPNIIRPKASPSVTTTYTITAISSGCKASDSVTVRVVEPLRLKANLSDTIICQNQKILLRVFSNKPIQEVNWSPKVGLSNSNSLSTWAFPTQTTTYQATVTADGFSKTQEFTISVKPQPKAKFSMSYPKSCNRLWLKLNNLSENAIFYRWSFGDSSPIINAPNPEHLYSRVGKYRVTLWALGEGGCQDSTTAMAEASVFDSLALIVRSIPAAPAQFMLPETRVYFEGASNANVVRWLWNTGDGQTYNIKSFEHFFQKTGTYYVSIFAEDTFGCKTNKVLGPYVVTNLPIEIPNVFTPNGDGVNDVWQITYWGYEPVSIEVFDRNGQKVFSANNSLTGWDGSNLRGEPAPPGLYYYRIQIGQQEYRGTITLLR